MPLIDAGQPVAFMHEPASSLGECALTFAPRLPIDVEGARREHRALATALGEEGFEVVHLPPAEDLPDGCFVEDIIVDVGARVLARPGVRSRVAERESAAPSLAALGTYASMPEGLTLDGGDVLALGERLFVGVSSRTSPEAARWLESVAGRPVTPVPVRGALHLKTVATAVDDRTVLLCPQFVEPIYFDDFTILEATEADAPAANVLACPSGAVLARAGFPDVEQTLKSAGARVRLVELEQLSRAEAGITCLSGRVGPRAGAHPFRFLCDEMLARAGRWLRIAGYDTAWCDRGSGDEVVLARALSERRVLLSGDRELVARATGRVHAVFVPSARLEMCVPHLTRELGVDWERDPWSRCVRCNDVIVEHEGPRPHYAPPEKALYACPTCAQVFWEGSHASRFSSRLRALSLDG